MTGDETELTPETTPEAAFEAETVDAETQEPVEAEAETVAEAGAAEAVSESDGGEAAPDLSLALSEETPPLDDQMLALMALEGEGLDVDQALAAVASLSELVLEQRDVTEAEAEQRAEAEAVEAPHYGPTIPTPSLMSLQRGQMASVIPAMVLIALGSWLTLTLTTSDAPPDARLTATVLAGALGVILATFGLSSGRWARGALFLGLGTLFSAATFYLLSQPGGPGLVRGWPVFLVAIGLAGALTGLLSPVRERGMLGIGVLIVLAGAIALAVTMNLIRSDVVSAIGRLWPAVLAAVLLIWLLAAVSKRRE